MKRVLAVVILAGSSGLLPAMAEPVVARPDVPFSQQVKLRDDLGPFVIKYRSFNDNEPNGCSNCTAGPLPISSGKVSVEPQTYVLVEQNKKYDYYLVQVAITTSDRKGTRSAGVLQATLRSTASVSTATHSAGYTQTAQSCHTYPIDLGASWGPFDASTTVGHYSTCVKTKVSHRAVKRGDSYRVTNLNGIKTIEFSRFVRVKAGKHPKFTVNIVTPQARCHYVNIPTTGVQLDCDPGSREKTWTIGTTGS
jgi:hypothetical protein